METSAAILIVEDEMITATSIAELLEGDEHNVIGIARDAAKALLISSQTKFAPAIVICDINIIGEINGVELATQLKDLYDCEIIFLSAYSDQRTLKNAFGADPIMYVIKPYSDTQLLVALQMAFHKIYEKQKPHSSTLILTNREKEIAQLVAQGLSSKQISRRLNISIETVKTHRRRMLAKNNISSFPQLIYLLTNAG
jgi:DNA-binding NarL/FixJ family response regulator